MWREKIGGQRGADEDADNQDGNEGGAAECLSQRLPPTHGKVDPVDSLEYPAPVEKIRMQVPHL